MKLPLPLLPSTLRRRGGNGLCVSPLRRSGEGSGWGPRDHDEDHRPVRHRLRRRATTSCTATARSSTTTTASSFVGHGYAGAGRPSHRGRATPSSAPASSTSTPWRTSTTASSTPGRAPTCMLGHQWSEEYFQAPPPRAVQPRRRAVPAPVRPDPTAAERHHHRHADRRRDVPRVVRDRGAVCRRRRDRRASLGCGCTSGRPTAPASTWCGRTARATSPGTSARGEEGLRQAVSFVKRLRRRPRRADSGRLPALPHRDGHPGCAAGDEAAGRRAWRARSSSTPPRASPSWP